MSTKAAYVGSDEEWRAYWKLLQIDGIASPEFANRIDLARELGLLAPLLAGDQETLKRLAAECKERLSAQIHWVYPSDEPTKVKPIKFTDRDGNPVASPQPGGVVTYG